MGTLSELPNLFVVCCNSQENVDADFMWTFLRNVFLWKGGIFVYRADHPWDVVRNNRAIKTFLDSGYDILVKCDIDQAYPANYFEEMAPLVEIYKVIGPVIYDRQEHNNYAALVREKPDGLWIDISKESGIHQFPYTHTNNFYAREVFESFGPPWYEAHMSSDGLRRENHVDGDVQDKLRAAGYPVYTNCDVAVEHIVKVRVNKEFQRKMGEDYAGHKTFL